MFLNNFWKCIYALTTSNVRNYIYATNVTTYTGSSSTITISDASSYARILAFGHAVGSGDTIYTGTIGGLSLSNLSTIYNGNTSQTAGANYCGAILGNGDTPANANDYCLSGDIITDFSATTAYTQTLVDGGMDYIFTYNVTNTGSDSFTIKEIGMCITNGNYVRILVERTVLTTPVTIDAGETKTIVYKIEFR